MCFIHLFMHTVTYCYMHSYKILIIHTMLYWSSSLLLLPVLSNCWISKRTISKLIITITIYIIFHLNYCTALILKYIPKSAGQGYKEYFLFGFVISIHVILMILACISHTNFANSCIKFISAFFTKLY